MTLSHTDISCNARPPLPHFSYDDLVTIVFLCVFSAVVRQCSHGDPANHVQASIPAFLPDQAESLRTSRFRSDPAHLSDPLRDFPLLQKLKWNLCIVHPLTLTCLQRTGRTLTESGSDGGRIERDVSAATPTTGARMRNDAPARSHPQRLSRQREASRGGWDRYR
jgi:hypothetical protein